MTGLVSSIEILIANLIINELAITRKMKMVYHYGIILLHTLVVFLVMLFLLPEDTPLYVFSLFAWTYLIPFYFIYKEKINIVIITMAFALTHSLFVKGLASHILIISIGDIKNWTYILLQTTILLVSTPLMVGLINKRIKLIIEFLSSKNVKLFLLLSVASFLTVFTLCFFIEFTNYLILALTYLTILFLLMSAYLLAYTIIHAKNSVDQLNTLAYEDSLTKIRNRLALYHDFQSVVIENKPCVLYFLDLDRLKNINDSHGHLIGDQYIIAFTRAVQNCITENMEFYRISGDEFVIVNYVSDINHLLTIEDIQSSIEKCFKFAIEFQGVSIGKSVFPHETDNLDSLLSLADKRMYVEKNKVICD